jgi:phosphoglucosamine mutase
MAKRLFGTDGIRAVAGEYPLDEPTVRRFGDAVAQILLEDCTAPCRVALGRDTRESGPWLRDAVASGLVARGASAIDAGVISTPGLAHVVRSGDYAAGVMISASHNPFGDNGLKAFGPEGMKLSDDVEKRIECLLLDGDLEDPGDRPGAAVEDDALGRGYVEHLEKLIEPGRLRGLRLVVDCANGSASAIALEVLRHHGAEVEAIGVEPDGRNINLNCGSLHLDGLAAAVDRVGGDLGIAFDGDADRCLAVDRRGRVVDGDYLLFITGRRLKREGRLRGDAVVATIMSNFWLEESLGREGIGLRRAPVGDKYVLEQMLAEDLVLGGEQSGHIIFRDHATTGDGILTSLLFLDTLLDESRPLEQILDGIVPYPQVLLNVPVRQKPDLRAHARVGPVVAEIESALKGRGRVVLRYSGTEPVARVMLEGKDRDLVRKQAEQLAAVIREELGA